MNLGAHMSIAGGMHNALLAAEAAGAHTLQVFTKQSNQWRAKPLTADDLAKWSTERERTKIGPIVAHDSYLINLGQPDEKKWREACEAFKIEMERCEALGIERLIMHPGAHMGSGDEAGLKRIAQAFDLVHGETSGFRVRTCMETTAGQGTCVGHRFEHLRRIIDLVSEPDRLRVCVDTCHIFAAGYDIRTPDGYRATFEEFERHVGLDRIAAFHVNDSKKPFHSRVDRHEHIGRGWIGPEAFRCLMQDERFRDVPMMLETPKDEGMDPRNLAILRALRGGRPLPEKLTGPWETGEAPPKPARSAGAPSVPGRRLPADKPKVSTTARSRSRYREGQDGADATVPRASASGPRGQGSARSRTPRRSSTRSRSHD